MPRPVFFLFTSVPPHASRIDHIVLNMHAQTWVPDALVLTVPHQYKRFDEPFPTEVAKRHSGFLRLNLVNVDHGPLCKYLGAITLPSPKSIAVVGDDDIVYPPDFIAAFAHSLLRQPTTVLTGALDTDFGALGWGVTGYSGVASTVRVLQRLCAAFDEALHSPECFLADDVVVTHAVRKAGLGRNVSMVCDANDGRLMRFGSNQAQHDPTSIYAYHAHHVMLGRKNATTRNKQPLRINELCAQSLCRDEDPEQPSACEPEWPLPARRCIDGAAPQNCTRTKTYLSGSFKCVLDTAIGETAPQPLMREHEDGSHGLGALNGRRHHRTKVLMRSLTQSRA